MGRISEEVSEEKYKLSLPDAQEHSEDLKIHTSNKAAQNKHHIKLHNLCSRELKMQNLFLSKAGPHTFKKIKKLSEFIPQHSSPELKQMWYAHKG